MRNTPYISVFRMVLKKKIWLNRISYGIDYLKAWICRFSSKRNINRNILYWCSKASKDVLPASHLLLGSNINKLTYVELFSEDKKQQILDEAEGIIDNQFRIFNHIKINASPSINWHKDYMSGKVYPIRYYKNMRPVNISTLDDPKVPWEFSRFHHGLRLAQAFALTYNEKYAYGFLNLFLNWCTHNPWKFGINWTCAMEVAIRACNLLAALELIKGSAAFSKVNATILRKTFQQHLDFILENLEWSKHGTTNHYISDLLGIIVITAFFPTLKGSSKAEEFGFSELEKEVHKQFYEDGGSWESSTTYQRFVTEMILLVALIAKRKGRRLSDKFRQRIINSVKLINSLSNIDGQIPQIGDNDSGRVIPFKKRNDTDIRHLGVIAALLYDDSKLIDKNWDFPEEAYWIFGDGGYERYTLLRLDQSYNRLSSVAFQSAGLFVMRSDDVKMVISAAPNGQNGHGGHCHNDKLSFTVSVGNQEILTDPGTFTYSGDILLRRQFRSTNYHNTLMLDKMEQNRYIEDAVFWIQPDAKVRLLEWKSEPTFDLYIGEHTGYARLKGEAIHKRSIGFDKVNKAWLIVDDVYEKRCTGYEREVSIAIHSSLEDIEEYVTTQLPDVFSKLLEHLNLLSTINSNKMKGFRARTPQGNLCGIVYSLSYLQKRLEGCWISDSYLSKYQGRAIRYFAHSLLPVRVTTFLWLERT